MLRGPLLVRVAPLAAIDGIAVAATSVGVLIAARAGPGTALMGGSAIALAVIGFLALGGAYRAATLHPLRAAGVRLLVMGVVAALLWSPASRWWLVGGIVGVQVLQAAYLRLIAHSWRGGRVLLIGGGDLAEDIAAGLREHMHIGLRVVGFVTDGPLARAGAALYPRLGPVEHLEKVLREFSVGRVVLATDPSEVAPAEEALIAARLAGIVVESGADCFEWLYGRLPLQASRHQLFLEGRGFEPSLTFDVAKRAGDVALSLLGLLIAAPVLALAALAVKLESGGPAFFHQVRLARHGRRFQLWKLRSMYQDAEPTGPALAERGDPRVTRVGRLLRRTRIDEIPQLWNVLRGDMSIVGPRPERPEYYDELVGRLPLFRHRLAVRPGLTGWAQVQQGYVNDWEGFGVKLSYDLFYLKRRCVSLDARVIWLTAWEMLQLKGV